MGGVYVCSHWPLYLLNVKGHVRVFGVTTCMWAKNKKKGFNLVLLSTDHKPSWLLQVVLSCFGFWPFFLVISPCTFLLWLLTIFSRYISADSTKPPSVLFAVVGLCPCTRCLSLPESMMLKVYGQCKLAWNLFFISFFSVEQERCLSSWLWLLIHHLLYDENFKGESTNSVLHLQNFRPPSLTIQNN